MMRHPGDWTRYSMLIRAFQDSESILVNLTFIRDKNDRFSVESKSQASEPLKGGEREVRTIRSSQGWVVGVI